MPLQTACVNRNSIIGGTIRNSSAAVTSVRIVFEMLENRFARIQPITPVIAAGAGIASTGAART